uniref:Uncharacterized protein LOC104232199 n=1 Tax=Nicotiana sylvestris TaxID=4096 RepID=A0A1U7X1U9_NICSY|nr:PREDICTED: uncharacterized protein LOC104232199 [Nicotiana sylvestris]
MGPRRAVDVVTGNQPMDLQEQYEDLTAQQLDLRAELVQKQQELRDDLDKHHGEFLHMVSALKYSFDGRQLNQQSKDSASTSAAKDKMLQSSQGILGPNSYCVNANRNHNLVFPRFNGENLKTWLYRIGQYFAEDETPLNQRVRLVAMNLDDDALVWHQSYLKCRNLPTLPAWDEYISELIETFGEEFADPMLELKQLRLAEATLAANARALKQASSGGYCSARKPVYDSPGLKSHQYHQPTHPPRLTSPANSTSIVPKTRRTISPAEMQRRRAQGLCYFCDDKFSRGHKCTLPKQMFVLELEVPESELTDSGNNNSETDSPSEEWSSHGSEQPFISLCAITVIQGAQTIHVTGYSDKRPTQILLDGGSTHNFIGSESAKRLGCTVIPTKVGYVSLGNNTMEATSGVVGNFQWMLEGTACESDLIVFLVGKYDLVLGALWMRTLGPVTMDYSALTMTYNYLGKQHILKDVPDACRLSSPKAVSSLIGKRYSSMNKDIIEKLVKEMLQHGVIQYSNNPFSSLVVVVGKKNGTWRLCVDYRELNQRTVKDKFHIPIIDNLLNELTGATIFSKIDLRSGYHQIRMVHEDVPKTAFTTHMGHYEYLVMPFGTLYISVFDEPLVISFPEKICVFEVMVQHRLLVKRSKCVFGAPNIEYLGHFISAQGVSTDPKKIAAVQQWPTPTTVKQLRGFLGLAGYAGYYRKFIKGYRLISRPLTELLRKDNFHWTVSADQTFAELKKALTSAPVLALPNYSLPFIVKTDASGASIGVVLMQSDHPIAFISKGLAPRHVALSVYERELLALAFAADLWKEIQDSRYADPELANLIASLQHTPGLAMMLL